MTKLSPIKLAVAVLISTSAASAQSFDYDDFSDLTGINPVGLTLQVGNVLQLQDNVAPASGGDNRGAAWYATPVNVASGFDTTFVYRMHTPNTTGGSDGMAFVIQNDQIAGVSMTTGFPDGTGNTALGRHASAAGFGLFTTSGVGESVDNSVAIHLDTFNNGTWGDTNNNHISIHTGGNGDNSQDETMSLGRVSPGINLNDELPHTIRVVYVPGTLEVYVDGVLELSVAYDFTTGGTYLDSGNAVGGLDLIGGTSAYVGFTSGAGSAREFRDLMSWEFTSTASPGTNYCLSTVNSTNAAATISATGSPSIAANDLVLTSNNLPVQPGIFIAGPTQAQIPFFNGFLCIDPSGLQRFVNVNVPVGGFISEAVDIATSAVGGLNVSAGSSYNYQRWNRDPAGGGASANFSDALSVAYVP